ncbi:hypothetical protein BECAL_00793 [Bellilinea caldifistulae]|nr:hypothetical protein BECAL_00793 [Bellilinea caldifistulae]
MASRRCIAETVNAPPQRDVKSISTFAAVALGRALPSQRATQDKERAGLGSPALFPQGLARIGGLQAEECPRHALQVDAFGLALWVIALAIRACSPAHPSLTGRAGLPDLSNLFVFHLAKVDDRLTRIGQFRFPYTSLRIEGRLFILPCQNRPAGVAPAGLRGRFGKDLFLKVLRPFGQVSPAGFAPRRRLIRQPITKNPLANAFAFVQRAL